MSVQLGMWNFDGQPIDRDLLFRISQSIAEFGPDGETTHFNGPMGMLYRPFHTTFESRLEHQPYPCVNGLTIIWDGRLDNRAELIPVFSDVLDNETTDLLIVAAALERWGEGCFAKILGDWAMSIWNPKEKELTLVRDFIGGRRLFYYCTARRVVWCSHLRGLALCGDRFSLCEEYIAHYLCGWSESQFTPYQEIRSVQPGHFVRIRDSRISEQPYWSFRPELKTRYNTDHEYEENFRHLLRQSVNRRLRTDSPVLAELSGGLDSSSIVCVADDIVPNSRRSSFPLDTFSAFDPREPEEDDRLYFTKVEETRGRIGHHAELNSNGNTLRFDYPIFTETPGFEEREEFRAAQLEVIRRGGYRVLLSGEGGDYVLGQGRDPRAQMADLFVHFRFIELSKHLSFWSSYQRRPWIKLLFQSTAMVIPTLQQRAVWASPKWTPWLDSRFARQHRVMDRHTSAGVYKWLSPPTIRESFHTLRSLSSLLSSCKPTLIDRRFPFLDRPLVEFLLSVPSDQLLRLGERRSLQRRALVGIVPKEILLRRTKAGAARCYILALQKHWTAIETVLAAPVIAQLGYISRERFAAALLAMRNGIMPRHVVQLLRALSLELWLRDVQHRGVISMRTPRAGRVEPAVQSTFAAIESQSAIELSSAVPRISASRIIHT